MENKQTKQIDKKEEILAISSEEKNQILEDLIFKGITLYKKSILQDKVKITLKNLSAKDQIEIEDEMNDFTGSPSSVLHVYSVKLLSRSLVKYNKEDFSNKEAEDVEEFLLNLATPIVDVLVNAYNLFNKKLQACTKGVEIDKALLGIQPIS